MDNLHTSVGSIMSVYHTKEVVPKKNHICYKHALIKLHASI